LESIIILSVRSKEGAVPLVVIDGDVDGNGKIESTDYMRVKSKFLQTFQMNEAQISAADVDDNGVVDATDYMRIKSQFLGNYDLYSN
jgi:hypothetical protein